MIHWLITAAVLATDPAPLDAAVPVAAQSSPPQAGEPNASSQPITLTCSGTYTPLAEPFADQNLVQSRNVTFEVTVDFSKGTVLVDGAPRVVRQISDDEIVYSQMKPGALSVLFSAPVTTISRKTGLYRNQYGRGTCQVRETKNLF